MNLISKLGIYIIHFSKTARQTFYKMMSKHKSPSARKKEEVRKRNDELDPNNNINQLQKPMIKRRGKRVRDDGFEHRSSKSTS